MFTECKVVNLNFQSKPTDFVNLVNCQETIPRWTLTLSTPNPIFKKTGGARGGELWSLTIGLVPEGLGGGGDTTFPSISVSTVYVITKNGISCHSCKYIRRWNLRKATPPPNTSSERAAAGAGSWLNSDRLYSIRHMAYVAQRPHSRNGVHYAVSTA
jgi:hypothetical protein